MNLSNGRLPSIFLLGAPRCATTSLFHRLSSHPDVAGSSPKETHYFVDSDSPFAAADSNLETSGAAGYARYLPPDHEGSPHLIDGSTHLLFQERLPNHLHKLPNPPRLVVIVRRPSQRIRSSFYRARDVVAGIRRTYTFREHVERLLNDDWKTYPRHVLKHRAGWVLQRDLHFSRYRLHLERWRQQNDQERLYVLVFEELVRGRSSELDRLVRDLALPRGELPDMRQLNRHWAPHNHKLHRLVRGTIGKSRLRGFLEPLSAQYLRLFGRRPTSHDDLEIAALDQHFHHENQQLASQYALDLTSWQVAPEAL